ncbi:response regulator transcription factor [Streptomyces sp. NPDC053750]|uniref:response regulator transcription factor n=1 Tax=Streptomyces sp. NPDC053750 TaxID=3365714 RepID=UPI0037D386AC
MDEGHATVHMLPTAPWPPRGRPDEPAPGGPAAGTSPVRVHVLGADPLARLGIRALLDGRPGIRVTGDSAPDADTAAVALRTHRPHVLVVHGPPPARQTAALARLAGTKARVLTMGGTTPDTMDGTAPHTLGRTTPDAPAPAHGHLPATATAGQVVSAVVLAAAGYTLVHDTARGPHRTAPASQVSAVGPDQLTDRECEVLELLARGLSNGEIAASLSLSEHTVKTHVRNLLHKLRLPNRVHAAIYAFEAGLRRPC